MYLDDIDLLSLQTAQMQKDSTVIALCKALNPKFQQLGKEVKACLIYSRIDYLGSYILDELAWQMHVDWYKATASIDVKRNLIKNALKIHRHKGTPYAVEQVVKDYFGDGYVEEWFEYAGAPYMFRVIVNICALENGLNEFYKILDSVKNTRSHLEAVIGLIKEDVKLETKYKEHLYPFLMSGTFQCGTKPDINNLANKVTAEIKTDINNTDIKQKYNMAGTFSIGGDTN